MRTFFLIAFVCARLSGWGQAVVQVTRESYNSEVLQSKVPVVLDAYTDWCRYCKSVAPLFAEMGKEHAGKIKFAKVNIDQEPGLAQELKIEALPTFLFYKDGKIVDRQAGALDRKAFSEKFSKYFR